MRTSEPLQQSGSKQTVSVRSISSAAVSPVKISRAAGKGAGIEGSRSGLWSEYFRLIREIRPRWIIIENVLRSFDRAGSIGSSQILPRSGWMRDGSRFPHPSSDSLTRESGSGFLPTPAAFQANCSSVKRPIELRGKAYRIRSNQGIDGNANLQDISQNLWGGALNPVFVEAVMGFPIGWTSLESAVSVMPSSRKSSR